MAHRQDFRHHSIKKLELARTHVYPFRVLVWVLLKELIWVVANLSQLHHSVTKRLVSDLASGWITS